MWNSHAAGRGDFAFVIKKNLSGKNTGFDLGESRPVFLYTEIFNDFIYIIEILLIRFDIWFPVNRGWLSDDTQKQFGVMLGIFESHKLWNLGQGFIGLHQFDGFVDPVNVDVVGERNPHVFFKQSA